MVTPEYGPQDERVTGLVDRIRADALPPGAEITGLTATYVDLSRMLSDRLWPVIGVVVATSFVMLMIVFRSLLAPLKAAAMNLLSIAAAYGCSRPCSSGAGAPGCSGCRTASRCRRSSCCCCSRSCSACRWTTRFSCCRG